MKRRLMYIPFGKGDKRIVVTLCRKPMPKGLAGMIRGRSLLGNLALIINSLSVEDSGFEFAALANYGGTVFGILMTPEVLHGIRRGDALARTCLFHELGHFQRGYTNRPDLDISANDLERYQIAFEGEVSPLELEADAFAAEYLGNACVIKGLSAIRDYQEKKLKHPTFDRDSVMTAIWELDKRIEILQKKT